MATKKIRVYELARELGQETKATEKVIRGLGLQIKNYMSTLTVEEANRVRSHVRGGKPLPKTPETKPKRRRATVIRRTAKGPRPAVLEAEARAKKAAEEAARVAEVEAQVRPVVRPTIRRRPVLVRDSDAVEAEEQEPEAMPDEQPVEAEAIEPVRVQEAHSPDEPGDPKSKPKASVTRESFQRKQASMPAVGQRIELPAGTRRLPGGLAERMADKPPPRPGRTQQPSRAQPRQEKQPEARPQQQQTQQQPQPQRESAAPKPSAKSKQREDSRRVVRNDAGVIVGVAKQRAEPRIKGFIQLSQMRPRQQVIITDAGDEPRGGRASERKKREERIQQQGRRRKMPMRNRKSPGHSPRVATQEMSEAKKRIRVDEAIMVADLAHQMGKKAGAIMRVLWGMGLRGLTINHAVDIETAELVAGEFGYTVENVSFQEEAITGAAEKGVGEPRAPVVTMMGHVDHGKTSLLDKIRSSRVADGESGGITQHIGAYKVSTEKGDVVFLDTPGHEAFSAMRSRGAQVTDVVVLVVAADDGVMPTTVEAIKHAKEAKVTLMVALNKVDKPEANPGRVKQMLMEHGLVGEEFGGETIIVEVSAKSGQGIDKLLEMLALQTELLDLRASREGRAAGIVLEARVDKGRGPIATVLIEAGRLKKGQIVVANEYSGKVRAILDDRGKVFREAGPSTPVEVLGLDGVPAAGDRFNVVESEKAARQLVSHRREQRRRKETARVGPSIQDLIARKKTPTLKIVLRADVQGSSEALRESLLEQSTDKVKVEVIFNGVGAITQNDVKMASAGEAVIIGFNTKPVGKAAQLADHEKVDIHSFSVIYEAIDKVRELMVGLLEPEYREKEQGEAEVRALFPIPRLGTVAGCRVVKGHIRRDSHIRVVRDGEIIHTGAVYSLRVFKDDVKEVREGFECGIVVDNFTEVQPEDILQAYEIETIPPSL